MYIDFLELKAVQLALTASLIWLTGKSSHSDERKYQSWLISRSKGAWSQRVMCDVAHEIVLWLELHLVAILARYIPRKRNILLDLLGRPNHVLPTEWSFLPRCLMRFARSAVTLILTCLL